MTDAHANSLASRLATEPLTVNLEILPPQNPRFFAVVRRRASTLALLLGAVHVVSRPDRMTSLDAALHLKARGWEPVWHLTARGRTRAQIEAELDRAHEGGVQNVLCLFGEAAAGDPGHLTTNELIARVAARGFFAGAAIDLNRASLDQAVREAQRKAQAGARFLQTQIIYDYEKLSLFADLLREQVAKPPFLLAGIMPVLSGVQVQEIPERLGIPLPDSVVARMTSAINPFEEGLQLLSEAIAIVQRSPGIHGLTLMILDPDEAPERVARVEDVLLHHLPHLAPVESRS